MAILRYTMLRVLILVVIGALLWLAGFRGFWLLLAAFFTSGIISIFVLRRSRDDVSRSLDKRFSTIKSRLDQRTLDEDAWNDAQREPEERGGPGSDSGQVSSS
jgi:membrane protein implicated in regulation of membrane protease activity